MESDIKQDLDNTTQKVAAQGVYGEVSAQPQSKEQALTPGIQEVWVDLRKRIGLCV